MALQSSFNGGELDPLLHGRPDLSKYGSGLAICENWMILPQGALERRPGFRYVFNTKNNGPSVLIPFVFSTVQAYIIELGDGVFRFFKDRGVILDGGGAIYELAHPYTVGDYTNVYYCQSADTCYLFNINYQPRKLTRTAHNAWTLTPITFTAKPTGWGTGSNGWPAWGVFHGDRLWMGGYPQEPDALYASKVGDYENLTLGANDTDAIKVNVASDVVNAGVWGLSGRSLLVGTSSSEFVIQASEVSDPITPSDITARAQTTIGSAPVRPIKIGNRAIYTAFGGRSLHEMRFVLDEDAYLSPELSEISPHLIRSGIRNLTHQRTPWRTIWLTTTSGTLVGCTYLPEQQVVAWSRFPLSSGVVNWVAAIPGMNRDQELWAVTAHDIGGIKRWISFLEDRYFPTSDNDKAANFHVDFGLTYSGAPVTTITGLDHLSSAFVSVLADGNVVNGLQVVGGSITLPYAASLVHVGLPFRSRLETLPIVQETQQGVKGQTDRGTASRIGIKLRRSMGLKVGMAKTARNGTEVLEVVDGRYAGDAMDTSPPLITQDIIVNPPQASFERSARIVMQVDDPTPCTITAINPRTLVTE